MVKKLSVNKKTTKRHVSNVKKILIILFLFAWIHYSANAQPESEASQEPQFILEEIIVVGDRSESLLKKSTTPSGVMTALELSTFPLNNLVDAISYLPGITFVNQDASGYMPMAIVRGFYGGGEAEYLLLNVDGVPVNDLNTGLINWNLVSISDIKRIEITRGGGSAIYGDLALGAVVNVITRRNILDQKLDIGFKLGRYGRRGVDISSKYQKGQQGFGISVNLEESSGYRDHSEYKKQAYGALYSYSFLSTANFKLGVNYSQLDLDQSGPLTQEMAKTNHRQSNLMFANDNRNRNQFDTSLKIRSSGDQNNNLSIQLGLRSFNQKETRTLQLTSEIGDTQYEDQDNFVLWGQFQYINEIGITKLIAGLDTEVGTFDSKYYNIEQSDILSQGEGSRTKLGLYLEGKHEYNTRFGTTFGTRIDIIKNDGIINLDRKNNIKTSQVLPRIGAHYQYLNSDVFDGHLFTNWSKSFKAPTLDQLYDTREINFFGQEFNYSNADLVPQTSTNLDIGLNQKIYSPSSIYSGEISLALYIMSISNEIDFDMATFKYGNILKSQHKGIEFLLGLYKSHRIRLSSTIDIAEVTFGSGDYEGNMLKNIPKITYTNRFFIKTSAFSNLVLTQKFFGSVYLDDANAVSLPSNSIFNCKLQFIIKDLSIDISLFNLIDKLYYSSGYLLFDPILQENVQFYFPAQRRYFHFNFNYKLNSL